ncbi:dienelactone hydrolase [Acuticoccus sediminis]|uniref:Dienelactone hydrolase n=1 Tax=Acuticoccus sediminis TaxID=2184697 RepID=A0A8B2NQW0_9HYPH|nr:dienelactone hydrolase family protein [Acuticoccus sediminis]RAH99401.1 dienelactone hydrolase [Acuticoccus sediminis]
MLNHALIATLALFGLGGAASADLDTSGRWSEAAVRPVDAPVRSSSPFSLSDAAGGEAPPQAASVDFYPAVGASAGNPAPAAILLHGAGGVSGNREGRYARELAGQGVAVAVIDVFGPRAGGGFIERLMTTTEAMALADAFATLAWLDGRPDVDAGRTALIGFSYGGMSSIYAAYRQVVETYAPPLPFAAHVSFYGPCVARFSDPTTTGAPVLMLWGEQDAIMDPEACGALADDLRAGGSDVTVRRYDARHRWDGASRQWRAPTHIADCRFTVGPDNTVRDDFSALPMVNAATRATILALCANRDGYLIGGDEAVRVRSNADLATFLNPILFPRAAD